MPHSVSMQNPNTAPLTLGSPPRIEGERDAPEMQPRLFPWTEQVPFSLQNEGHLLRMLNLSGETLFFSGLGEPHSAQD